MNKFNELFEKIAKTNDRTIIWNNWLEYCIQINLINHNGEKTNFYDNEKKYFELMESWLNELTIELETKPYYDILGHFYEELVQSKGKSKSLGQSFTPQSVTDLMKKIVVNVNNNRTSLANDPTCGSSRTLLAAHVENNGDLICIGQDLDITSCQMGVLNFWSHGVRGSILHMDTLTGDFYQGWRVNKYLYHGLPVPHIEEIHSIDEAYDFFELKKDNMSLMINGEVDEYSVVDVDVSDDYKPKGTGQTTLF